jgi:putative colanic acid biosynthesis acetyltransferase WcaF
LAVRRIGGAMNAVPPPVAQPVERISRAASAAPIGVPDSSVIAGANPYRGASFSWRNRLGRVLWSVTYICLFRPSPRPLHAWRVWILACFGARIGRHVHVYPKVQIWAPWNLELGDCVGIADDAHIYNMGRVRIGAYSSISMGALLCGGTHAVDSENFQLQTGDIHIGDFVWICAQAYVGPDVEIPEGAVVAARAVVARSLPLAWTIYAGVPAVALRSRSRAVRQQAGATQ